MIVKVVQLDKNLPLPRYETDGSAALDLRSREDCVIEAGKFKGVPTGIKLAIPKGFEAQVRARSGHAFNRGVGCVNGVGTIDSDFRGEIKVILINWGEESFEIKKGDRIAQLLVNKHETIEWEPVEDLSETKRNENGLGSTGIS